MLRSLRSGLLVVLAAATSVPVLANDVTVRCDYPRGLCGVVDTAGKLTVPPKFEAIDWYYSSPSASHLRFFAGGKVGLIDRRGEIVLPAVWQELGDVNIGYTQARQGDRIGLIDLKGAWVIPPRYSSVVPLNDDLFAVETRRCESNECRVVSEPLHNYGINYPADCTSECTSIDPSWHFIRRDGTRFDASYVTKLQPIDMPVTKQLFVWTGNGAALFELVPRYSRQRLQHIARRYENLRVYSLDNNRALLSYGRFDPATKQVQDRIEVQDGAGKILYESPPGTHFMSIERGIVTLRREAEVFAVDADGRSVPPSAKGITQILPRTPPPPPRSPAKCDNGLDVVRRDSTYQVVDRMGASIGDATPTEPTLDCKGVSAIKSGKRVLIYDSSARFVMTARSAQKEDHGISTGVLWQVEDGGASGLLDATGKLIAPFVYKPDSIRFDRSAGQGPDVFEASLLDGTSVRMHVDGSQVPIRSLDCRLQVTGLIATEQDGFWGYKDVTGAWIITPRFPAATCHNREGIAMAAVPERRAWCPVDKTGRVVRDDKCTHRQQLYWAEGSHSFWPIASKEDTYEGDLDLARGWLAGRWKE